MTAEDFSPDFPEYDSQTTEIWDALAEWWDDKIGDGNNFQDYLIEPATERLLALKPGELVTAVQVPPLQGRSGSAYVRHTTREAMDIAAVGVAVALRLGRRGAVCEEIAIALGAVAPTPMRAREAEKLLRGRELTPELIAAAAECAAGEARPISDVRASAGYRRELVRVLTQRMIGAAREDAQQKSRSRRKAA